MYNILVPTDFSIKANNAIELAKKIAASTKGKVTLMHVVELPGHSHTSLEEETNNDNITDVYIVQLIEKSKRELKMLFEANNDGICEISMCIKSGDPFTMINSYVKSHHHDLIIAGDKGHSQFEDMLIGSLSDKLIRRLECPVITVKAPIPDRPIINIAYVANAKGDEERIMKYLKSFNQHFKAKIHLVWINTPSDFKDDIETFAWLSGIARDYNLENFEIAVHNHHDEEFGVVYFADQIKADIIAMGITKKTVVQRLITGDTLAEEVSDHTIRPVMTMKLPF